MSHCNSTLLRHLFLMQLESLSFLGGIEKQALQTLSLMSKQFIFNIPTIQRLRFQIVNRRGVRQEFIVRKGYIRTSEEKCQPIPRSLRASRPGEQEFSGDLPLAVHQCEEYAALGTVCSVNLCQPMAPGRVGSGPGLHDESAS